MTGNNKNNSNNDNNGGQIAILRSTSSTDMEENDIEGDACLLNKFLKKNENETDDDDVCEYTTAVAKRGGQEAQGQGQEQEQGQDLSTSPRDQFRQSLVTSQMLSFKKHDSYPMAEDVYAFIVAAPVCSWSFLFASYVIGTKYIVYATLLSGISFADFDGAAKPATAVKFFLIPVAIAMQSDLMAVYATLANARYCEDVLKTSKYATFNKFVLAYILRLCDGLASLSVNFGVMLTTDDVLGVFLNFAALHFLQDIDDVFYSLVEKGFFGDRLEHMSTLCKQMSWPRRVGNEDCWKSAFITSLDTILFTVTLVICLSIYIAVTARVLQGKDFMGHPSDTY